MSKRVTLKDIAQAADVTTATVSYVLNDAPDQTIPEETRSRILKVARELNYVPNSAARSLRRNRTGCIGVVARKNLAVPRFSQTIYGIQSELEKNDISLLICTNKIKQDGISDYLVAYLERRVDGIIFLGKDNIGPDPNSCQLIAQQHIPFVVFDCFATSDAFSTVDFDYRGGARLLVEHMLERRPHKLLYIKPQTNTPQESLREEGLREALRRHPQVELRVISVPINLKNLDTWDLRYSIGETQEGHELTESFMQIVQDESRWLEAGDALVASWSGWTDPFRYQLGERGIITAELANNGESHFNPDYYTRLPNFDAGVACAEAILARLDGKSSSSHVIRLTSIVESP